MDGAEDSIESLMMSLMDDDNTEDDSHLRETFADFIDSAPKQKKAGKQKKKETSCQCKKKTVQWLPHIEGGGWKRKRKGPAVSRGGMTPEEIAEYTRQQAAQGPISTFDLLFAMRWHRRRLLGKMMRDWKVEVRSRRAGLGKINLIASTLIPLDKAKNAGPREDPAYPLRGNEIDLSVSSSSSAAGYAGSSNAPRFPLTAASSVSKPPTRVEAECKRKPHRPVQLARAGNQAVSPRRAITKTPDIFRAGNMAFGSVKFSNSDIGSGGGGSGSGGGSGGNGSGSGSSSGGSSGQKL
jgi:hypothetical protein